MRYDANCFPRKNSETGKKNCTAAFLTQEGKSDAGNNITGHA